MNFLPKMKNKNDHKESIELLGYENQENLVTCLTFVKPIKSISISVENV